MTSPLPELIVLDVNETLSDMSAMAGRFADVGRDPLDARLWFAEVLRDGFALTAVGQNPGFADLASTALARRGLAEDEVAAIMSGFTSLTVHPDVAEGLRRLARAGARVVTLSNGAASVAQALLERAGVDDVVERFLSVADGPAWKPDPRSYATALTTCGVSARSAMLVAVHPWDVDGAARAGLRTAWVRRGAAGYPSYHEPAELEVDDLLDLAEHLGA